MPVHKIKRGLDLPISGTPLQQVTGPVPVSSVAIMADDFPGMKPRMLVKEGAVVRRGQPLFEDRKSPGVFHVAPGAGTVSAINRGARRTLQSVVIKLSPTEAAGQPVDADFVRFESFTGTPADKLTRQSIVRLLLESGLWTALRTRPFSRTPAPEATPYALFVNAMDTNPLAAKPEAVITPRLEDFVRGLTALSRLTTGKTHLCVAQGSELTRLLAPEVTIQEFAGPHPAGTTGVHVHFVAPVGRNRTVWTINYQDVIAFGALLATGRLDVSRVVSLAGPPVTNPRLVATRLGANLHDLCEAAQAVPQGARAFQGDEPDLRLVSGSVLSGKRAQGNVFGFLGRHHLQVSVLREDRERQLLGWLGPGTRLFSVFGVFASRWLGRKTFELTTNTNGSPRAMVPIGAYEKVMPMDIMPTFLLRSLLVGDLDQAEKLGVLELDEEDLALCTFVCPGKTNYGPVLRANLEKIYAEG